MSSSKSLKKTGVQRIPAHIWDEISSKVGVISTYKIPENEKKMLPKCTLVDKELLSSGVNAVKSFKKTRKSSSASTSMKKLAVLDTAFVANSWQNGPNSNENKRVGKKIIPLEERNCRNSILPGKLKSTSTKFLLSDGKSSDFEDIDAENEENYSTDKSVKKLFRVLKKNKLIEGIQKIDSNLEKHKITKSASKYDVTSEDKEDCLNEKPDKMLSHVMKKVRNSVNENILNVEKQKTMKRLYKWNAPSVVTENYLIDKPDKKLSNVLKKGRNSVHQNYLNLGEHKTMGICNKWDATSDVKDNYSKGKSNKRLSHVLKKKNLRDSVHERFSSSKEHKIIKNAGNWDEALEVKENYLNDKPDKKLSHVLKKNKVRNSVHQNYSNLGEHKIMESSSKCDATPEIKENYSTSKSVKTLSHVLIKRMVIDSVHGSNLSLKDNKIIKRASNSDATSDDKNNYKFKIQPLQHERLKMSEIAEEKRSEKPSVKNYPLDSLSGSADKSAPIWHCPTRKSTANRECYPIRNTTSNRKCYPIRKSTANRECYPIRKSTAIRECYPIRKSTANQECYPIRKSTANRECYPIRKSTSKWRGTPTRRSARIAAMEKINYNT